jgi:exodeoxyribonuclease VII large subunit
MRGAATRVLGGAAAELAAEARALGRLDPASRLTAARQRAGELLDRASRAIRIRLGEAARSEERLATALPVLAATSLGRARAGVSTAGAALAVLGPQATLDRGYAIVRRTADAAIVRAPADAPTGTGLDVRVAAGSFPATAGERG